MAKTDGDATPLGQRPLSVLPVVIVFGLLLGLVSLMDGFGLGYLFPSSVLGVVVGRWRLGTLLLLILRRFLLVPLILIFISWSRSLGLPGWFRHAYFEYHAHVRLRFKLASGLGEPWTRDGGIP